jgi:zinc transporter, ZIP family
MPAVVDLILVGSATALATGIGAIPVFVLGERAAAWRPLLWGFAAGVMGVTSIAGLLLPALDRAATATVLAGLVAGVAFLVASRLLLRTGDAHIGARRGAGVRSSILVFGVLFVHSLPEGFAIGTAYASNTAGLGLFVIVAIALQNIPEGTSIAIPMQTAGFSRKQQFWAAVATSAPQPVGAVVAYVLVETITGLLAVSFAFAAGAMLSLIAAEMLPQALAGGGRGQAVTGALVGAALMIAFSAWLGV